MIALKALYVEMQAQLQRQLPFVVYKKPGAATVTMLFQKDSKLHAIENYSESGFVFAKFNATQQPVFIPSKYHLCASYVQSTLAISSDLMIKNKNLGKEAHLRLVSKGIAAIQKDHFKKVVLSRKEEIKGAQMNCIDICKKLFSYYPKAFCYLWFHPETGIWLGATPETLFHAEDHRITTMALAGTQKFKGTTNVVWHKKEKAEQQLVVDFIMERLNPISEIVHASDTITVKAGNLLHLKTDITAVIRQSIFNIQHLVEALHPTPAVCGYPMERAKQFILDNENYDREFYTGFLGVLNFSATDTRDLIRFSSIYVNLRCMKITGDKAVLYVGGGITEDSIPEREWEETVNKTHTMRDLLVG